ncbi:MAG TPA: aldehyde dehydrogenase family protein [Casimicrobiaceae bacterium]|nr:aldehyde dehydrogenase family protein [Casimicrobiaceae bacterium]
MASPDSVHARAGAAIASLPGGHYIDGRVEPGRERMPSFDPGTGEAFAEFAAGDGADVDRAVSAARVALDGPWRRASAAERGRVLMRAAALIRDHAERLALIETLDVGKPLRESRGDVAGAARAFEYYAGACDKLQGDTIPLDRRHLAWTVHEPVGVCAQVVPWNYPTSTAARGLAPALAAGCAVVVKPAETTPFGALLLAQLLTEAGLPPGVCNVVTGTGAHAGAPLVAHPDVAHVTFTGSVPTGISVMQAAARNVTRVVLELGGKSPVVVLADADLDTAAREVAGAIFENAGQICSAGSRLVIARPIHDAFVARLAAHARTLRLGHGLTDPGMGPLNSLAHQRRVAAAVDAARSRGAVVATGGHACADPLTGRGWFFAPTILTDLAQGDPAVQEEIFGPVLAVAAFDDLDEAVELANGTRYALAAGVFTRDFAAAHRLARDLDAGQVYVNEYFAGGIEVPFGGNRRSGFGREKGLEGLLGYCRTKAVAARIE